MNSLDLRRDSSGLLFSASPTAGVAECHNAKPKKQPSMNLNFVPPTHIIMHHLPGHNVMLKRFNFREKRV